MTTPVATTSIWLRRFGDCLCVPLVFILCIAVLPLLPGKGLLAIFAGSLGVWRGVVTWARETRGVSEFGAGFLNGARFTAVFDCGLALLGCLVGSLILAARSGEGSAPFYVVNALGFGLAVILLVIGCRRFSRHYQR